MAPPSAQQFALRLVQGGLFTKAELNEFVKALPQRPADGKALAAELLRAKRLTRFQAETLYRGDNRPLVLGNYVILDKLGAGGMGEVYKAEHRRMERVVALKVLPPSVAERPASAKRFEREAKAAARLAHPNVVTAHDCDQCGQTLFLVMEYVPGDDLGSLVRRKGPLPVRQAVDCVVQAAKGLEYAHARGVVHRDIKPANLLLDESGTVKVLDLGLARIGSGEGEDDAPADDGLTATGTVMGTVDYMAPEQALDTKHADHRADIYSLGCTLYFLLTARPVYGGDTLVQKILAHREEPVPSLRQSRPELPAALQTVFERMVAKNPQERYQSMTEVIAALEASLQETVIGEPPASENAFSFGVTATGGDELQSFLRGLETGGGPAAGAAVQTVVGPMTAQVVTGETAVSTAAERTLASMPQVRPTPPKTKSPPNRKTLAMAVAGLLALVALLGVVFRVDTPAGTVVLEFDQPALAGAEVSVDGEKKITLKTGQGRETIKIEADEKTHTLKVTKGGFATFTKDFTVDAGTKRAIRVRLEPPNRPSKTTPEQPAERIAAEIRTADADPPRYIVRMDEEKPPLPGVAVEPARLPGIGRWQIETRWPRAVDSRMPVAWSPDGKLIAFGDSRGTIRLYDAETLDLVRILAGHLGYLRSLAWSPDGKWLASGSSDDTVRLWSADGRSGPTLPCGGDVFALAWTPDGQWLASGIGYSKIGIRLWKPDGTPGPAWAGHGEITRGLSWSPNGKMLASGGTDGLVKLWDRTGKELAVISPECSGINSIAWSPDGERIAFPGTGEDGRFYAIWNIKQQRQEVRLPRMGSWTNCLTWHPIGGLAAATQDGFLSFYDAQAGKEMGYSVQSYSMNSAAWSPDGQEIVDGNLRIFQPAAKQNIRPVREWLRPRLLGIAWPTREAEPVIASEVVRGLLQVTLSSRPGSLRLPPRSGNQFGVDWSTDGQWLADRFNINGGQVRLWKLDAESAVTLEGNETKINCAAFSPAGQRVATGEDDGTIRFWSTDGTPGPVVKASDKPVTCLSWSPDATWLASAGDDGAVRLWKPDGTAGPVFEGHSGRVRSMHWAPDGRKLVSGANDRTARIWHLEGTPGAVLADAATAITAVAWSPDGQRLITGYDSGTIRMWRSDGERVYEIPSGESGTGRADSLVWSPDGSEFAHHSTNVVIVRDAATGEPKRVTVLSSDGLPITFSAGGELLHGDAELVEKEIMYLVERTDGRIDLLKPSEFETLIKQAGDADFSLRDFGDAAVPSGPAVAE